MVKKAKCSDCRLAKQKCLPEMRTWELNGKKIRCDYCEKGNRPCGPSEIPPSRPPRRRRPQVDEDKYEGRIQPPAGPRMASEDIGGRLGLGCVTGVNTSDNSQELWDQLNRLDADAKLANELHENIKELENRLLGFNVRNHAEYHKLLEWRHTVSDDLLSRLRAVEALGDHACNAGEFSLAEITYNRVLDIYRRQHLPLDYFIRRLLEKMALFYWKADRPFRAEECWRDILKLRESTRRTSSAEVDVLQWLAISFSKTSGIISETFRPYHPEPFSPLNSETPSLSPGAPFHPVHTMIKKVFCSDVSYNEVGREPCSAHTTSPNVQSARIGGARSISEIIQKIPDTDLTARDILHQTPLFLAASNRQEDAGHALITRLEKLSSAIQIREMNARDIFGQTILGIAILSGCSSKFIMTIIEHGAVIDPDPMPEPPTPLQAACTTSNADVVELLLERGAKIHHVYPGNLTPVQLAQIGRNDRIIQLIAGQTRSPSSSAALPAKQNRATDEDKGIPHRANIFAEYADANDILNDGEQNEVLNEFMTNY